MRFLLAVLLLAPLPAFAFDADSDAVAAISNAFPMIEGDPGCRSYLSTNPSDSAFVHAIFFGETHCISSENISFLDFASLLIGEFRGVVFFAQSSSAFFNHVTHVVSFHSKSKMVGTNASHVVALVEYEKTFGDGSVVKYPRKAMRQNWHITCLAKVPVSIATLFVSRPNPTGLGLENKRPKTRLNHFRAASVAAPTLH